jgi:hypothetical protein
MPLHTGNRWVLRVTEVDSDHVFLRSSPDTVAILRDTVIAGDTWFIDQSGDLRANRAQGLWTVVDGVSVLLKYPAAVNDSSTFQGIPGKVTIKVMATTVLISVPAGQFTSNEYRYIQGTGGRVLREEFYAPGFGLVKAALYDTTPGGQVFNRFYLELLSQRLM